MARVNLYISNEVHEKINMIVEKRRQEEQEIEDKPFRNCFNAS